VLSQQPQVLQVACFDTAFRRGHSEMADRYAVPEQLYSEGVRRYGFHGLSYEYIASRLPEVAPEIADRRVWPRTLAAAALCAHLQRENGLPKGTRSGQLDPGVVLYLMNEKRMSGKEIEHLAPASPGW
jgi:acetate kinase